MKTKKASGTVSCDYCGNLEYDEEDEVYYCAVNLDEDEMASFLQGRDFACPYYQTDDEYKIVRHQI